MTDETNKALDMLDAFAGIGVKSFDVTFTDLDGNKLGKGGFLRDRSVSQLRHAIGMLLKDNHGPTAQPDYPAQC